MKRISLTIMFASRAANYWVSLTFFLLGLGGLTLIIFNYSPVSAPWFAYAGLYFCVFLTAFGLSSALLQYLLSIFRHTAPASGGHQLFRQALILGVLMTVALGLQAARLLNVFTISLLVVCAGILELYWLNSKIN